MSKKLDYLLKEVVFKETTENTKEITSKASVKTYKASITDFTQWAKEAHGINRLEALEDITTPKELIKDYVENLKLRKLSPSTIHTRVAPICKGFRINIKEIDNKPCRTASEIIRGRNPDSNVQGRKEIELEKYKDFATFAAAVGIRRSEYSKLKASDICRKVNGNDFLYVHVAKGKGGKEHWQRILPIHQEVVLNAIKDLEPTEKLFKPEELRNHINLHKMRAHIAKEAYQYYASKLLYDKDHSVRANYVKQLVNYYKDTHKGKMSSSFKKELNSCLDDNNNFKTYYLKGDNRDKAQLLGLPVQYNRLAVLMVSVFHLSHWRADVTVTNYLNQTLN